MSVHDRPTVLVIGATGGIGSSLVRELTADAGPEHENRVLRVVVNTAVAPIRVVSVYFDRTMKGKL